MSTELNPDIELQKLELEREKVKLERFKAWWTGISIIIPLVVAIAGITFSVWNQAQQAKLQSQVQAQGVEAQLELQSQQAKSQFEIKAAEIVMNMESPLGAQTKAKALANMFPERLPQNFAASFDPTVYSMPRSRPRPSRKARAYGAALKMIVDEGSEWRRWNTPPPYPAPNPTPIPAFSPQPSPTPSSAPTP